ncbi:MAG: hypothetical protein E7573_10650 [Ruminococcaceae bacterium]|nr:hypothetical protein [Oscillospiraceae bacterium]
MKTLMKTLSIFLSLLLVLQAIPLSASAMEIFSDAEYNQNKVTNEINEKNQKPYVLCEDTSKRQENVKHFKMSDGTYQAAVYGYPVHFSENGAWKDIDNTIKINNSAKKENQKYVADISGVEFSFPDKINSGDKIRVKKNGHEILFGYIKDGIQFFRPPK